MDDFKTLEDYMRLCRQALHQIPELGEEEFKTSQYIISQLEKLQIPYEKTSDTGIIATLNENNFEKGSIAFRADMDALPIEEKSAYAFPSKHLGKMHACGHDVHMAMLLGLCHYLKLNTKASDPQWVFIFQPAEEGPGGAQPLVEKGYLKKYAVKEIYGIHVHPDIEEGQIGICKGPAMAMVGEMDVKILGKKSHGAMPHKGNDALLAACQWVNAIQTIVSRRLDPIEPAVVTIGKIEGGERRNILTSEVSLEGTLRVFDEKVFEQLVLELEKKLKGLCIMFDVDYKWEVRALYPPVFNDASLVERFTEGYNGELVWMKPQMISEDFSYYQKEVPGVFYFLGTRNTEKAYTYGLHHEKFQVDDRVMLAGLKSYLHCIEQVRKEVGDGA